MARDGGEAPLDRELADLPPKLRWREWVRRVEAVLFASARPVPAKDLARVAGQGASVELLIEELAAEREGRSFEVAQAAGGWMLRTRLAYAPAIRAAAEVSDQSLDLREFDVAVLAAIACRQPISGRAEGHLHLRVAEWMDTKSTTTSSRCQMSPGRRSCCRRLLAICGPNWAVQRRAV